VRGDQADSVPRLRCSWVVTLHKYICRILRSKPHSASRVVDGCNDGLVTLPFREEDHSVVDSPVRCEELLENLAGFGLPISLLCTTRHSYSSSGGEWVATRSPPHCIALTQRRASRLSVGTSWPARTGSLTAAHPADQVTSPSLQNPYFCLVPCRRLIGPSSAYAQFKAELS
jgi:hypothetical protein